MKALSLTPAATHNTRWDLTDRPARMEGVPWREVQERGIVLDLQTGDYLELNDVALFIWKQLDGTNTVAKLSEKLLREYDVTVKKALADICTFLTALEKSKLISR